MVRLAVLASGGGTNLQAIIDAARQPGYPAELVLVLSDKPAARALERARAAGIPTAVVTWEDHGGDRAAFTHAIVEELRARAIDLVALAGFMRILGAEAVDAFPGRILNTHPSLLPAFRGAHAVADALAAGVKVTGVTIHVVDAEVDHGPIVAQEAVRVEEADDEASLHDRIRAVEHRLYPAVIAAFAAGDLVLEGGLGGRVARAEAAQGAARR
jgi:phosphoribosylglycinamide formyltransferase-1